jgi:hypothetical protein
LLLTFAFGRNTGVLAHSGPTLSGSTAGDGSLQSHTQELSAAGTATIDGLMSDGEWTSAAFVDFLVNLPAAEGGGQVPARLFEMNDETNLYLALLVQADFVPLGPSSTQDRLAIDFDDAHDGANFTEGDDALSLTRFSYQDMVISKLATCPPTASFCIFPDFHFFFGGTTDGEGMALSDGASMFFEIAKPLASADPDHDFTLSGNDVIGMRLRFARGGNAGRTTNFPVPGWVGIRIISNDVRFFLNASGPNANPTTLFLDNSAPVGPIRYRDSAGINFNGGNAWKDVGIWNAPNELASGELVELDALNLYLGLKNSDDQGTWFDVRADVMKNGQVVTSGLLRCVQGVTRNPNQALQVDIPLELTSSVDFDGTNDILGIKLSTRIGTNEDDSKCGGHNNATGLRVYFGGLSKPPQFFAEFE